MTAATKHTASNNQFLYLVKRVFNAPTFKRVSEVYNAEGRAAAIEVILCHTRVEDATIDAWMEGLVARMDADKSR